MTTSENIEKDKNLFWQVSFSLPANTNLERAEIYEEIFSDIANSSIIEMAEDEQPHKIKIMFQQKQKPRTEYILDILGNFPELKLDTSNITIEKIENKNWLEHVYREFSPITIENFFVFGERYDGTIPKNLIPLQISTAMAFGSGEHQTTQGCLLALQKLKEEGLNFTNILDMGCGSGILSVAATKLWPNAQITAIDIEEDSVKATSKHARINNCNNINAFLGDGYKHEAIYSGRKFDLIISNIFANVLIDFSNDLSKNLNNGGYAILAGLLDRQIEKVLAAHEKHSMQLYAKNIIDGWAILSIKQL